MRLDPPSYFTSVFDPAFAELVLEHPLFGSNEVEVDEEGEGRRDGERGERSGEQERGKSPSNSE